MDLAHGTNIRPVKKSPGDFYCLMRIFKKEKTVSKLKRIMSAVISVCFLINTIASDMAFGQGINNV